MQFAGVAAARGGGFAARIVQVRALIIRDRFEDAEQVLAAMEGGFASQDDAGAYLDQRVTVLYWGLKRRADAMALLDRAHGWWPDERLAAPARAVDGARERSRRVARADDRAGRVGRDRG